MTSPTVQEEGWIEWRGGENPVPGERVDTRFRGFTIDEQTNDPSESWVWNHFGGSGDIIAYRVVSAPLGEPEDQGPSALRSDTQPATDNLTDHPLTDLKPGDLLTVVLPPVTGGGWGDRNQPPLGAVVVSDGLSLTGRILLRDYDPDFGWHPSRFVRTTAVAALLEEVTAVLNHQAALPDASQVGIGPLADEPKNTPAPTEKGEGVLPCPFCGDPMKINRAGTIEHVVQTEGCILRQTGVPVENIAAWNRRAMIAATQQATGGEGEAVLAEAVAHLSNMATTYESVDLDDWCATMPADIRASQLADATAIRVVLNALATQQAVSPAEGVEPVSLPAREEVARALEAFGEGRNLELAYCYDPDIEGDEGAWCVHRVNGGRNDREWTLIAKAATPADAILSLIKGDGRDA